MYDVSVVPCPSYDPAVCRAALEAVLAPLGGLDWVRPGMRIAATPLCTTSESPIAVSIDGTVIMASAIISTAMKNLVLKKFFI